MDIPSLIPKAIRIQPKNEERLLFYGREFLGALIKNWKETVIRSLDDEHYQLEESLGQVRERIRALRTLAARAESKPIIPGYRAMNWIQEPYARVFIYTNAFREAAEEQQPFAIAEVLGPHEEPLRVSFMRGTGSEKESRTILIPRQRHEIMKTDEFAYLVRNPDFAGFWLDGGLGAGSAATNKDRFAAALGAKKASFEA